MIDTLVLFGATGDLAGRLLLPALAALREAGRLPEGFAVIGAARPEWDDDVFRRHAGEWLAEHAPDVTRAARDALVRSLRYQAADVTNAGSVREVIRLAASGGHPDDGGRPVAAYLALPPRVFPAAVTALAAAALPAGSRIVLEKPFGEDLETAVRLNALLRQVAGDDVERMVFRVDHVLGMATVQNLLAMRLANRVLDAVWNSAHIEVVEILWEETLALEGRAGYFDHTGTLKDVMQNHMLQILSLVAMEPPSSLDERDVRDRKVEALRSVRTLHPEEAASWTRRARYGAGRLTDDGRAARDVPSYVDEDGVDARRGTETFAEVVLEIDNGRWKGTSFVLRTGKALGRRWKGVVIRFRPLSHLPSTDGGPAAAANELRLGLDGPDEVTLCLNGGLPHPHAAPVPLVLTAPPPASGLPAYARVLLDILDGGCALSVRGDEAEQAWRILTPVLDAWARGVVPLEEYAAGSAGPPPPASRLARPQSRVPDDAAARG